MYFQFSIFSFTFPSVSSAQTGGTIHVSIRDESGAAVAGATGELALQDGSWRQAAQSGESGDLRFQNLPWRRFTLKISANHFASAQRDVTIRSNVPEDLSVTLRLAEAAQRLTIVEHSDAASVDPE